MNTLSLSRKKQYNILSKGSSIAGAVLTRNLLKKGWKKVMKKDPPLNPASPGVVWRDALLWGAATGMLVGITKTISRRLAASAWRSQKGAKPKES